MMRWGRQPRPGGQDRISGTVDWQLKSYTVSTTGSHTFKWRYTKDSSGSIGSDCGWVDKVQWTGQVPPPQGPLPTVWGVPGTPY